jgi:hypothetical protein
VPELIGRAPIAVDERREAHRLAADDGQRHRQAVLRGADDRVGAAADADDDRQPPGCRRRIYPLLVQA